MMADIRYLQAETERERHIFAAGLIYLLLLKQI